MPASAIIVASSARDGGVFRYNTISGSIPLSRNRSSVLRDVEHFGLCRIRALMPSRRTVP